MEQVIMENNDDEPLDLVVRKKRKPIAIVAPSSNVDQDIPNDKSSNKHINFSAESLLNESPQKKETSQPSVLEAMLKSSTPLSNFYVNNNIYNTINGRKINEEYCTQTSTGSTITSSSNADPSSTSSSNNWFMDNTNTNLIMPNHLVQSNPIYNEFMKLQLFPMDYSSETSSLTNFLAYQRFWHLLKWQETQDKLNDNRAKQFSEALSINVPNVDTLSQSVKKAELAALHSSHNVARKKSKFKR